MRKDAATPRAVGQKARLEETLAGGPIIAKQELVDTALGGQL